MILSGRLKASLTVGDGDETLIFLLERSEHSIQRSIVKIEIYLLKWFPYELLHSSRLRTIEPNLNRFLVISDPVGVKVNFANRIIGCFGDGRYSEQCFIETILKV